VAVSAQPREVTGTTHLFFRTDIRFGLAALTTQDVAELQ
jgi:hypothetical protein